MTKYIILWHTALLLYVLLDSSELLFLGNMIERCPLVEVVHTCNFHRKSRRAVDSTCWACRYSAKTKTVRITGVMTLRDTLVTTNGLQGEGQINKRQMNNV